MPTTQRATSGGEPALARRPFRKPIADFSVLQTRQLDRFLAGEMPGIKKPERAPRLFQ
jgi:hypothetical protein